MAKGPSLGTSFTLVSPYTLLAHYYELPWAAEFGVSDRLIRVSVGTESYEVSVWSMFVYICIYLYGYLIAMVIYISLYSMLIQLIIILTLRISRLSSKRPYTLPSTGLWGGC